MVHTHGNDQYVSYQYYPGCTAQCGDDQLAATLGFYSPVGIASVLLPGDIYSLGDLGGEIRWDEEVFCEEMRGRGDDDTTARQRDGMTTRQHDGTTA